MVAKTRIIIDTDPDGDDLIAMLLGLAASQDDLEILLISVVFGNVPVEKTLRNAVAMFHVLNLEMKFREDKGLPLGFEGFRTHKPIVAVGAAHGLDEDILTRPGGGFHGPDGWPNLTPEDAWKSLYEDENPNPEKEQEKPDWHRHFTPSKAPAHREILQILREEPHNTVTICAVGPLTNIALAASEDPETFLRAKEVVIMGGAVNVPGNMTPVAEFNTWADAAATAQVFALSSSVPSSTMPGSLPPYPETLSRQLKITLFPLDVTSHNVLDYKLFSETIKHLVESGSPLAILVDTFLGGVYRKLKTQFGEASEPSMSLHDPLTVWYVLARDNPAWHFVEGEDIRVETSGGLTRGMLVADSRGRTKADGVVADEVVGDDIGWLSAVRGNRINRATGSPGAKLFTTLLMREIFSL
ncbi:inosine-uridine preferring nucleoside hydrolase [Colletotrichum kahawae]|uniref:Inosine-uridine preferring nucleoside hydrolase n=1 Tax=Colletotrichum kahawae TaxID=34407 RepID=A0AAE0D4G2_COLKA|nr:inosine-uridine preferring nucleoside hydrolase [Colletotrichum kahawae]